MPRKERIVRYSAEELVAKPKRGESRSDWARSAAMTNEEIEADIASDPDEAGMVVDWDSVSIQLPKPKADLHMRIDRDVLEFSAGPDAVIRPHQCGAPLLFRAREAPVIGSLTNILWSWRRVEHVRSRVMTSVCIARKGDAATGAPAARPSPARGRGLLGGGEWVFRVTPTPV